MQKTATSELDLYMATAGEPGLKSSKYEQFRVPVPCEWTHPDGGVCGVCFSDVRTFSRHVKGHYDLSKLSAPALCAWSGCDFVSTNEETVLRHILFHPFHAFLKLLGAELQEKFGLPACQIDEQYKNLVPPIPTSLKCQWDNGKCLTEFESVGEFYLHLRDHVMVDDSGCQQCRWKGWCMRV